VKKRERGRTKPKKRDEKNENFFCFLVSFILMFSCILYFTLKRGNETTGGGLKS
jgi:hypothetical protein